MPLFNGSIVDGMLGELAQRWITAPDCAEPCNVADVRFHLEVIANERRDASALFEQSGHDWQGDSGTTRKRVQPQASCPKAWTRPCNCSDDTLAVLLDCHAAWCHEGDAWKVRMESSASATAGAQARAAVLRDIKQNSDYEDEFEDEETRSESIEVARIKYKHALRRLAAEFPELMIPPGLHAGLDASAQETRPCPCGGGKLPRWPWALQTVCLGFCPSSHKYIDWSKLGSYEDLKYDTANGMHDWEMLKWRDEWMLAAPGGERICNNAW